MAVTASSEMQAERFVYSGSKILVSEIKRSKTCRKPDFDSCMLITSCNNTGNYETNSFQSRGNWVGTVTIFLNNVFRTALFSCIPSTFSQILILKINLFFLSLFSLGHLVVVQNPLMMLFMKSQVTSSANFLQTLTLKQQWENIQPLTLKAWILCLSKRWDALTSYCRQYVTPVLTSRKQ